MFDSKATAIIEVYPSRAQAAAAADALAQAGFANEQISVFTITGEGVTTLAAKPGAQPLTGKIGPEARAGAGPGLVAGTVGATRSSTEVAADLATTLMDGEVGPSPSGVAEGTEPRYEVAVDNTVRNDEARQILQRFTFDQASADRLL